MADKKSDLINIVGEKNVIDDLGTLDIYSKDQSFVESKRPLMIIKPSCAEEIQKIVKWANQTKTPLVPVSSGPPHFHGDTVPSVEKAVVVDLSCMKRIIRIDRRTRMTIIEPGVTYSQLQPELAKEGLRLSTPLLPRANKSVVASLLERQPTLVPKYHWSLPEPLRCLEVVWGTGDKMMTGEAGDYATLEEQWKFQLAQMVATGPGQIDYHRLVSAAQGTMGIITWASIKCEILPQIHKLFFIPSERFDNLIDCAYRLVRLRLGDEFLILNASHLAYILGEDSYQTIRLRKELKPWVIIVGVAGRDRLPKERVQFQEKDVFDIAQQFGLHLSSTMPGASDRQVLEAVLNPSTEPFWKLRYKGGCQDIFFLTILNRIPELLSIMFSTADSLRYPTADIGVYLQPVHQGVCYHCELNLPYKIDQQEEIIKVQEFLNKASEELIKKGAFFSRPYGVWANMVYDKNSQSTILLKKVKEIFDPNNVLNPGKLCFN